MTSSVWVQLLFVTLLLAGGSGCGHDKRNERAARFQVADENKWVFEVVQKADQLILYEGLPHPTWEPELLAEERRTKETVTLHEFSFYASPIAIPATNKEKLKSILADEQWYCPWQGEGMCGGFHPDYLAEWHVGDAAYQFLVCFGCLDVWVYGPDKDLRYGMSGKAAKTIEELLKKHRKHRPPKSTIATTVN